MSTLYSSIYLLFLHKFDFKKVGKIVKGIIRIKHFPKVYPIIWICLLTFQFTYFGNPGIGDTPRIQLGHWKTINNTDWTTAHIEVSNRKTFLINRFYWEDEFFFGEIQVNPFEKNVKGYLIWNLNTDEYEYCNLIKDNEDCTRLTNKIQFELMESFDYHFHSYWGGWKFWF